MPDATAVEAIWGPGVKACNCQACVTDGPHWSDCAVHGIDNGTLDTHDGIDYSQPCNCDKGETV